jgi:hypothetical protein
VYSLSTSMGVGVGWSPMTDMAESLFNSSGGRLSGWLSRSYLWGDDREYDGFVGDCLVGERRDGPRRCSRSFSRGRSLLGLSWRSWRSRFSGEDGGLLGSGAGVEADGRGFVLRSGVGGFFFEDLFKKFGKGIGASWISKEGRLGSKRESFVVP